MIPTREPEPIRDAMGPPNGRMYRTMSGLSLAADHEQILSHPAGRRGSEQVGAVGGKKNFRSKRFSRNIDREPGALKRAQSFHMDQRDDSELWHDSQRRPFHRLDYRFRHTNYQHSIQAQNGNIYAYLEYFL